jgi:hypothetical protein
MTWRCHFISMCRLITMNDTCRLVLAHQQSRTIVRVPDCFGQERCLDAMAAIETDLSQIAATLTEAEFHAPTRTGGWSVAYCIEHLVLTGQSFLPIWDAALREAVENKRYGDGPFPYPWWRRRILSLTEPPHRLKFKTPQSFTPSSRRPTEEGIRRFLKMHKEFALRIDRSRGIDAGRTAVQSPFVSWIKYPLGFSFDIALAHERRHLWQASQVRRQLPSAGVESRSSQRPFRIPG